MPEINASPADQVSNIEGTKSTSPYQGGGLSHAIHDQTLQVLFRGRVEDVYPASGACLVSLYNYKSNIGCIPLSAATGRWYGARDFHYPTIGGEVLVYMPHGNKTGYIVNYIPTVDATPTRRPAGQIMPESGVNSYSDQEAWFPADWNIKGIMPRAGGGMPVDALPGDRGWINENNVVIAIHRLMALLKGSELAKVEAYSLDDLLNIVGHNLNEFTALGERRVRSDYGRITEETFHADNQHHALGLQQKDQDTSDENESTLRKTPLESALKPKIKDAVGLWCWRIYQGTVANFRQAFFALPPKDKDGSLSDTTPETGLYQSTVGAGGARVERAVMGGGIHKALQIAVPKRIREVEDPEGDREIEFNHPGEFQFNEEPGTGASWGCQLRDAFAWAHSVLLPDRFRSLKKDFITPDEADCPAPGDAPQVPGLGSFFRDFPPEVSVDPKDPDSRKIRVGEAWVHVFRDGSVSIKDEWGSQAEFRGGHINFSASKDITFNAGGSIVLLAGDDIVGRARQSIDLTATKQQIRIKAKNEVIVHSTDGGLLFSTAKRGRSFSADATGEDQGFPGITFKTEGGITFAGETAAFNIKNYLLIDGQTEGQHPDIFFDVQNEFHWNHGGCCVYDQESGYVMLQGGGMYGSSSVLMDGSIYARGSMVYGGSTGQGDFDKVPTIESLLEPSFTSGFWQKLQSPYQLDDIPKVKFGYRTTDQYATDDGKWFEACWQRDLADQLTPWTEEADEQGEYPYPGRAHFDGGKNYWTYQEANVELSGKPKSFEEMKQSGGKFSSTDWNSFKTHPIR